MTTGKTIALTRRTFVGKVMSLLFNMLSRLVITVLPRSKHLLISWLQSPSAVILEPRKIKSATVSTVSPSICHEVMGLDAMIFVFWMLIFKPTFHSPLSLSSRGSGSVKEMREVRFITGPGRINFPGAVHEKIREDIRQLWWSKRRGLENKHVNFGFPFFSHFNF